MDGRTEMVVENDRQVTVVQGLRMAAATAVIVVVSLIYHKTLHTGVALLQVVFGVRIR